MMHKQIALGLALLLLTCFSTTYAQNETPFPQILTTISVANGGQLQEIAAIHSRLDSITQVSWSPDGTRLAVLGRTGDQPKVEIWTLSGGSLSGTPALEFSPSIADTFDWLPGGHSLVTHGTQASNDEETFSVIKWDTETGQPIDTLLDAKVERPVIGEYQGEKAYDFVMPPILAWNKDYTQFASSTENHAAKFSSGMTFSVGDDPQSRVQLIQWSPDDSLIAIVYGTDDTYQVALVNSQTLNPILSDFGEDYWVVSMDWSPDSSTLAAASIWANPFQPSVNVRFYHIGQVARHGSGEVILSADIPDEAKQRSASLSWSPDSQMIGIAFPSEVAFYESHTFSKIGSLKEPDIMSLDWNISNKLIVGGDADGVLHFWGNPAHNAGF